ncbi:MAG: AMP-binding protein [Polyangiaceae bacterium]
MAQRSSRRARALAKTRPGRTSPRTRSGISRGSHADSPTRGGALGAITERPFVALVNSNRREWVVADVACVLAGWVVVPIAPTEPDDRLADVFARMPFAIALVEPENEARVRALARVCPTLRVVTVCGAPFDALAESPAESSAPPFDEPSEDALYTIGLTSGSTGQPKGAMRSYATFHAMVQSYGVAQPAVHLSFQPLSHLSERMYQPAILLQGGAVAFSRGGAHVMAELRALEPTALGAVPRLYDQLHAGYQRALRRLAKEAPEVPYAEHSARALTDARAAFGRRLQGVSVGSAPVRAEVLAFLRTCFADVWVTEGYGSTEVGTIAVDGKVQSHVEVRLLPTEASSARAPTEEPRVGEIAVRSKHAILGYWGDDGATRSAVDADGYFRTGDLGERQADGAVRVVGRLRNVVKLANGEFVSTERVEAALASAPSIDCVYVHAEPGALSLAAVIHPRDGASLARVSADVRRHGLRAGLATAEIPARILLLADPPTVENGLLTASGKLARRAFEQRFASALAALEPMSAEPSASDAEDADLASRLAAIASRVARRPISAEDPLTASVDSLAASEILAVASEELGRHVPLSDWYASANLAELAARLESFGAPADGVLAVRAAERDLASPLRLERRRARALGPTETVLLTGATGFLGVHVLEELLRTGDVDVVCLVRGADAGEATRRLRAAMDAARVAVDARRLSVVRGDLAAPGLGLDAETEARLTARVDGVLHVGATVSWLAPYEALRGPNVEGTRALLELASRAGARFHFVSTISTAPSTGDERTTLDLRDAAAGSPYALAGGLREPRRARGPRTPSSALR